MQIKKCCCDRAVWGHQQPHDKITTGLSCNSWWFFLKQQKGTVGILAPRFPLKAWKLSHFYNTVKDLLLFSWLGHPVFVLFFLQFSLSWVKVASAMMWTRADFIIVDVSHSTLKVVWIIFLSKIEMGDHESWTTLLSVITYSTGMKPKNKIKLFSLLLPPTFFFDSGN